MTLPAGNSGRGGRLVVVSNRLPVVLSQAEGGAWQAHAGSGGLVTALMPVLQERGGNWIGWPGVATEADLRPALAAATGTAG